MSPDTPLPHCHWLPLFSQPFFKALFRCLSLSLIENLSFPLTKLNEIAASGNAPGPPWQLPSVRPRPLLHPSHATDSRAPATADLPLVLPMPSRLPWNLPPVTFGLAHIFNLFSTNPSHQYPNVCNISSLENAPSSVPCFCLASLSSVPFFLPSQPSFSKK